MNDTGMRFNVGRNDEWVWVDITEMTWDEIKHIAEYRSFRWLLNRIWDLLTIIKQKGEVEEPQAESKRLRDALEIYANPKNWSSHAHGDEGRVDFEELLIWVGAGEAYELAQKALMSTK